MTFHARPAAAFTECLLYPGSHPGECTSGSAATLEQAKADFEVAWGILRFNAG